jgi:predicted dehydrogenase
MDFKAETWTIIFKKIHNMINWGIIGCGNVTEVKSGPAFNKVADSRLLAVMRRNTSLAEDYARRHNVPKVYSKASDLINDREINAIYIATPPGSHAEYALEVIRARKPVYIEKPMAVNYQECVKINKAAEKFKVPVFVAYYRRTLPGFLLVKDLIANGSIGKVRCLMIQLFKSPSDDEKAGKSSWRVDPQISGGGHFFDLASHQLDYLDFMFGPIRKVKSFAANQAGHYEAEDFVSAEFSFDNGIIGTGIWCFSVSPQSGRDTIEIIGDSGSIKFTTFSFEPIVLTNVSGRQEFINERPENVQYYLIEKIVRSLHGNGVPPSTGISGARTGKVMDEIVKDYYKEKRNKI